jgi:general L-amino acid transport system permease protein
MSDLAEPARTSPPPLSSGSVATWFRWRTELFGSRLNTILTLGGLVFLAWAVPPVFRWTILDATWTGTAETCETADGACWAFIAEKLPFLAFGPYPAELRWQPATVAVLLVALVVASCVPRLWNRLLPGVWIATLAAAVLLMSGEIGTSVVSTGKWGGLVLTILLCIVALAGAFPIAVLLAVGRRSNMAVARLLATGFIEVVRGVPLIAVLYAATLMLPLMLPDGVNIAGLNRSALVTKLRQYSRIRRI